MPEMGAALRHRGPDSSHVLAGPRAAIGCERLRIVDLAERADQPFHDPSRRYWLACNGEIYNASELRARYPRYPFVSGSDVESILPLFLHRGESGVDALDGMFAFAIWDQEQRSLVLGRDRAGEKPLFYTLLDNELWFASEVQALLVNPRLERQLDEDAVAQYLAYGYIHEPGTAFRDIHKVPAGSLMRFTAAGKTLDRYWRPEQIATAEKRQDPRAEELATRIQSAVKKQLIADVPVGVLVSGGLDSSLIATLAAQHSSNPLHTYVARFADSDFDESRWAARCARRAGTRHHEVRIDEASLAEALVAISAGLAEPLADPAVLPTYLVAQEARKEVKVVLGGEGADELFGGYPSYLGHQLTRPFQRLPRFLRRSLRAGVSRLPASRGRVPIEFLLKRFVAHTEATWAERHSAWIGVDARSFLRDPAPMALPPAAARCSVASLADAERAMLFDYGTYLPDDLLVKTDRATMLHSLEARSPFLDRDLTQFAFTLPLGAKIRGLTTKHLLKKAAHPWLPQELIKRRKRGLSVPTATWLDRGLRNEVNRVLDPARLERQDLFDVDAVRQALAAHREGKVNCWRPLWSMVCFQLWLERWIPARAEP